MQCCNVWNVFGGCLFGVSLELLELLWWSDIEVVSKSSKAYCQTFQDLEWQDHHPLVLLTFKLKAFLYGSKKDKMLRDFHPFYWWLNLPYLNGTNPGGAGFAICGHSLCCRCNDLSQSSFMASGSLLLWDHFSMEENGVHLYTLKFKLLLKLEEIKTVVMITLTLDIVRKAW